MKQTKYIILLLISFLLSITVKSQELIKTDSLPGRLKSLSNKSEPIKYNGKDNSISFAYTNALTQAKAEVDTLPVTTNIKSVSAEQLEHQALLDENKRALLEIDTLQKIRLRTNLLHWAVLVPNIGLEWRINPRLSVQANGGWAHLIWKDKQRHYRLFYVSAEGRYYVGNKHNAYIGAAFNIGQFNFKFKDVGQQGDMIGASLTGGYILELSQNFDLDFGLGIGYFNVDYEKYTRRDGRYRLLETNLKTDYWGPTQVTIGLVWKIKQTKR